MHIQQFYNALKIWYIAFIYIFRLPILQASCYNNLIQPKERNLTMFKKKTNGYVIKLSPQGPKMRFKSEKEAQEYLAKLKEKNNKYRN